jgi:ferredoxin
VRETRTTRRALPDDDEIERGEDRGMFQVRFHGRGGQGFVTAAELLGAPGERYAIDYDFCKGCGICAAECPCGAIAMVPEQI